MSENLGFVTDQLTDWTSKALNASAYSKKVSGITIAAGNNFKAGMPLGRITATGKYTKWDPSKSDGSEVLSGILCEDVDATSEDAYAAMYVEGDFNIGSVDAAIQFGGMSGLNMLTFSDGIFKEGNIVIRKEV